MRKVYLLLYCLSFFAISLAPFALMPLFQNQPNYDNRFPAEFPALTVDGKPNNSFSEQFEAWFSDHFAMRPYAVTAYDLLYLKTFGESKQDKVVAGQDGWLYFSETLDDYLGLHTLSLKNINDISTIISLCAE